MGDLGVFRTCLFRFFVAGVGGSCLKEEEVPGLEWTGLVAGGAEGTDD